MPAKSKAQQALMGMAYAVRTGKMKRSEVDKNILDIVDSDMSTKDMKHFAETSKKSLPQHLKESLCSYYGDGPVFHFEYVDGDGTHKIESISAPYLNAAKDEFSKLYPDCEIVHIKM